MSRSYKHSPVVTDGRPHSTQESKKMANKKIRHTEDLPMRQRGAYKKFYCSYDIHDYISRWTWEDAIADWEAGILRGFDSLKELRRYWEKWMYRK